MTDAVIRVDNLSKKYLIGRARGQLEGQPGLRHALEAGVRRAFGRLRGRVEKSHADDEFWALKGVSFEVKRGGCVGVIGRNGAGKSTLLKVLSRITEPTGGEIRLRGRVGSLLEVGTGFHPELTGRENIYLNGNILGMTHREVKAKFDQIVAFSEVEQFLDTPVKRYSSGMYVRLAFAVAAHLEPEILIVDEVLAVGDAAFQKKCLGRMGEVAGGGRTVLFVSHNMAAVRALCQSAVVLAGGQVAFAGDVERAVEQYQARSELADGRREFVENAHGIRLADVRLVALVDNKSTILPVFGQSYRLVVDLNFSRALGSGTLIVKVHDLSGVLVSSLCSAQEGVPPQQLSGAVRFEFDIPQLSLLPRMYSLSISVSKPHDGTDYLAEEEALRFEVQPAIVNGAMWPYTADRGYARISDCARVGPA